MKDFTIALAFAMENRNHDMIDLLYAKNKTYLYPIQPSLNHLLNLFSKSHLNVQDISNASYLQCNSKFYRDIKVHWLYEFSGIKLNKKLLIKGILLNGFDVNSTSHNGETLLMMAVSEGAKNIINLLLSHPKININAQTNNNEFFPKFTVLMFAAIKNNKEVVEQLLNHGADKTIKNKYGETACDIAYQKCNMKIAMLLCEKTYALYIANQCTIS